MTNAIKPLALPSPGPLLMHSCCAPCAGDIMQRLHDAQIDYTVFFYNPNIHPRKEYDIRKAENIRFAEKHGIPFIDGDYSRDEWFERMRHLSQVPERGLRCTQCFDMRFEVTAQYAHDHGFPIFTSSLGISRWKNRFQIDECGIRAACAYPGLTYWTYDWRSEGGSSRMLELSKEEEFYQQEYCGCVYSLRDSNAFRIQQGRNPIKIGELYYKKAEQVD